jgi:hypothetical protein
VPDTISLHRAAQPGGSGFTAPNTDSVSASVREIPDLELALLRRGVDARVAGSERCGHCQRTPLIGERVYIYERGSMLCELCRAIERETPLSSRLVHGPAFGHTMRITDRRAA